MKGMRGYPYTRSAYRSTRGRLLNEIGRARRDIRVWSRPEELFNEPHMVDMARLRLDLAREELLAHRRTRVLHPGAKPGT